MTIEKGSRYGEPAPVPQGLVVAESDSDARRIAEEARVGSHPIPPIGLVAGDLARTLGAAATGASRFAAGSEVVVFTVDLGEALLDGRLHYFVAHLVARTPTWSYVFAAMNAQWLGRWNAGPRAHPNDGLLDTYEARLSPADRWKVRGRLHHGAHLPHPGIKERRTAAMQVELPRPLPVELDGDEVATARHISVRVHPDALTIAV